MRVIKLPLPGADSTSSHLKPSPLRFSANHLAAFVSFPGGLVVSMRIRSLRKRVTSSSTSFSNCLGISSIPLYDLKNVILLRFSCIFLSNLSNLFIKRNELIVLKQQRGLYMKDKNANG